MPLAECRVVGALARDGVLDDRIAEMVDDRGDREDATQSLVQALFGHRGTLLLVRSDGSAERSVSHRPDSQYVRRTRADVGLVLIR